MRHVFLASDLRDIAFPKERKPGVGAFVDDADFRMQIAKRTESKIGRRGKFGEDTQLVALKSTLRKAAKENLKCYSPALSELLTTHLTIEIPCPEAEFTDTL